MPGSGTLSATAAVPVVSFSNKLENVNAVLVISMKGKGKLAKAVNEKKSPSTKVATASMGNAMSKKCRRM